MAWFINADINEGYPTNTEFTSDVPTGWTNTATVGLPANLWRISPNVNEGYPYNWWLIAVDNGYINSTDALIGGDAAYTYGGEGDDPNTYTSSMSVTSAPSISSVNKYYALDSTNIVLLYSALLDTLDSVPSSEVEDYLLSHFLTTNPVDLILNLRWYPFDFADLFFDTSDTPKVIFIGGLPMEHDGTNVIGYKARSSSDFAITFNIGHFNLYRHFGDFRDFEPYSGTDIYVPFCTPIKLENSVCMGHDIYVQMSVDLLSGCCTAMIRLDSDTGIIIGTSSGSLGVDLPVSGVDQATYNNAVYSNIQNAKAASMQITKAQISAISGGIESAGAAFTKGASGFTAGSAAATALGSVANSISAWENKIAADYQLSHTPVPYHSISALTSMLSMLQPLHSYAIITRPVMLPGYTEYYAHTTGYATIDNAKLSDYSGLTRIEGVDLSGVTATETELSMLRSAFANGVYL